MILLVLVPVPVLSAIRTGTGAAAVVVFGAIGLFLVLRRAGRFLFVRFGFGLLLLDGRQRLGVGQVVDSDGQENVEQYVYSMRQNICWLKKLGFFWWLLLLLLLTVAANEENYKVNAGQNSH